MSILDYIACFIMGFDWIYNFPFSFKFEPSSINWTEEDLVYIAILKRVTMPSLRASFLYLY